MKYDKLPNSDKLYIGIDQSLSCTSICLIQNQEIEFIQIKPSYMGVSRLSEIYKAVCELLEARTGAIAGIAIEGYAFAAKGTVFNLGEVGGIIRLACYQHKAPLIEVPPTFLKKFMTGKGNVGKELMIKEAFKRFNVDIDDNNDSDAFALALTAFDYFENEIHHIKAYREPSHKNCLQVVGEHPKPLDYKEYYRGMPDVTIAQYEKQRKAKKKELDDQ